MISAIFYIFAIWIAASIFIGVIWVTLCYAHDVVVSETLLQVWWEVTPKAGPATAKTPWVRQN